MTLSTGPPGCWVIGLREDKLVRSISTQQMIILHEGAVGFNDDTVGS